MGDGSVRLMLLAVGIALVAMPAWSQGAMTPGGGAVAPQPRVAPALPAPVVTPQAPMTVAPNPTVAQPVPGTQPLRFNIDASKETDAGVTFGGRLQTGDGLTPTNGTGATGGGR
jgi:hypothetical protein